MVLRRMNKIEKLKEQGPSTVDELGGPIKYYTRIEFDVYKLKPPGGGVRRTPVFYLDEHDPEEVVRTFISKNRVPCRLTKWDVSRILEGELKEAWQEIEDEFDLHEDDRELSGNTDEQEAYGKCPGCGAEIWDLASHLPDCDEL